MFSCDALSLLLYGVLLTQWLYFNHYNRMIQIGIFLMNVLVQERPKWNMRAVISGKQHELAFGMQINSITIKGS